MSIFMTETNPAGGSMSFINQYQEIPLEELRQEVEERLQWAYAYGHLGLSQLEERLNTLHSTASKEDLLKLVEDLPSGEQARGHGYSNQDIPEEIHLNAFLSSNDRKGVWTVPRKIEINAILGSVTLDMRDAEFHHNHLEINGKVFLGSIDVKVPENVSVRVSGTPILGSISDRTRPVDPSKQISFSGLALLGSFTARTRKPRRR